MGMAVPNSTESATLIGDTIRTARIRLDLSKSEAARRAGVSRRTWHEVEEGQRVVSTPDTLAQFDQVLGLPEGTLFAMTSRSSHSKVEELRRRAISLIRTMSSDELDAFVASEGKATIRQQLAQLDADIRELRDALPPTPTGKPRRPPRTAQSA